MNDLPFNYVELARLLDRQRERDSEEAWQLACKSARKGPRALATGRCVRRSLGEAETSEDAVHGGSSGA